VKKYFGWAILALILSLGGYYSGSVIAQNPGGPGYGPPAAAWPKTVLIDVNYIFKHHERFKNMMGDMKNDVAQAEKSVNDEKSRILQLDKKLQDFVKGTPDYKALDEDITRAKANLAVKVQDQRNDFLQREAQIYNTVYQEILQATDYFCRQNGIDMVLRFNGDPVDPQRPDSVLTFINRPVVWYPQNVDITPIILKDLNRTPVNAGGGAPQGPVSNRALVPFGASPLH
jgi:outer membrane protein